MNKRSGLITVFAIVAVAVGYFALRGSWPPGQGTQGAIGAAQRYQSDQISDSDVSLQDADVQAFIQSDVFHKLSTSPEFRRLLLDSKWQDLAARTDFQDLMKNPVVVGKLGDATVTNLLVSPAALELVQSTEYQKLAAATEMKTLLENKVFYELVGKVAESKATSVEFEKLITVYAEKLPTAFVEYAKSNPAVVLAAVKVPAMLELSKATDAMNKGGAELLARPDVATALENKVFVEMLSNPTFLDLVSKNPAELSQAFNTVAFERLVMQNKFTELDKAASAVVAD